MPSYDLSDIAAAADAKYGDLVIPDVCTLRNSLRVPKTERNALKGLQEKLSAIQSDDVDSDDEDKAAKARRERDAVLLDGEDVEDALVRLLGEMLELVADSPASAARLRDRIGDDVPLLLEVFERYGQVAQPGEASSSAS